MQKTERTSRAGRGIRVELNRDNLTSVGESIGAVSASAQSVLSTLSDC